MILLVGSEKGGTGKSTVAVTLAAMRARRGADVLLVDADPQGTASMWADERAASGAAPLVSSVSKTISGQDTRAFMDGVRDLATRFDDVIIDAGGRDSRELRASLVVADRVYVPIQPSYADAWTLDRMHELLERVQDLNPLAGNVIISRAPTHPGVSETEDAIGVLKEFELLRWCGVILYERAAYRRALGFGLCVEEMESPDAKAISETEALYRHAFE